MNNKVEPNTKSFALDFSFEMDVKALCKNISLQIQQTPVHCLCCLQILITAVYLSFIR